MELIKQNTQTKIIKSLIVIFLGSVILAISAKVKIKNPTNPLQNDHSSFRVFFHSGVVI